MAIISQARKKKAVSAVKRRAGEIAAKDRKRAVTLYLDRDNFEMFQRKYGRKTSQAVDELIAAVVDHLD